MTERQGAYTISTQLFLTPEHRARLERFVLEQRIDLADLVSIVVGDSFEQPPSLPETTRLGSVAVPTRLYLTPAARARIEQLMHDRQVGLPELISTIVAEYLDTLPDPPPPEPAPDHTAELQQRRSELVRLRARRDAAGTHAPAWLHSYIAELEAEVRRLESFEL
jgi:hypothetical protein